MTKESRHQVASTYRLILDSNVYKKLAMIRVTKRFKVSRRSVYRYCAEFKIPTD